MWSILFIYIHCKDVVKLRCRPFPCFLVGSVVPRLLDFCVLRRVGLTDVSLMCAVHMGPKGELTVQTGDSILEVLSSLYHPLRYSHACHLQQFDLCMLGRSWPSEGGKSCWESRNGQKIIFLWHSEHSVLNLLICHGSNDTTYGIFV